MAERFLVLHRLQGTIVPRLSIPSKMSLLSLRARMHAFPHFALGPKIYALRFVYLFNYDAFSLKRYDLVDYLCNLSAKIFDLSHFRV